MGDRITVEFPPGVVRTASAVSKKSLGRWLEANLVRWISGTLRPVPGWERINVPATASPIRVMHQWSDNLGQVRTAILCDAHLYVMEGGDLIDISPTPPLVAPTSNLLAGGYGDNVYNLDTYGTPRPDRENIKPIGPAFTLSNWGENLLAMSSVDGRLLQWVPNQLPVAKAEVVVGAPDTNRTFVVTPERHVILFGIGGDTRSYGWCSREDINDWDFTSVTNTAGQQWVEPAAPIVAAKATNNGIIFWTTVGILFIRYTGLPYIYSHDPIGDGATPLSAQAVVVNSENVMWPSASGFHKFNGHSIESVPCDLFDWFQKQWNTTYLRYRIAGMTIGNKSEMWWFFPSGTSPENDKCIFTNFDEGWWSMGKMSRTCGIPASLTIYPFMADSNFVYIHERGGTYYGQPDEDLPWAEATINFAFGSVASTVKQGIPDTESGSAVLFDWRAKQEGRIGPAEVVKTNLPIRANGYLDIMTSGRDHTMKIKQANNGSGNWSFGQMLLEVVRRGKK